MQSLGRVTDDLARDRMLILMVLRAAKPRTVSLLQSNNRLLLLGGLLRVTAL
jgi:hypothetical protein